MAGRVQQRSGFTIVEVMIVMALAAIAASLVMPSLSLLAERWRVNHAISELQSAMNFAKAQAIRTRSRVVIAAQPAGCRSSTDTKNWSCGMTIFQDINTSSVRNAGKPVLREVQEFHTLTVMHAGGSNAQLVYGPHGAPIANPSHFEVYPSANPGSPATQTICLSSGGRIRVKPGLGC